VAVTSQVDSLFFRLHVWRNTTTIYCYRWATASYASLIWPTLYLTATINITH